MTTERSEATHASNDNSLIQVKEDGFVMLGKFKNPIGLMVKNPFEPTELFFQPMERTFFSRQTLLMLADHMPVSVRK